MDRNLPRIDRLEYTSYYVEISIIEDLNFGYGSRT